MTLKSKISIIILIVLIFVGTAFLYLGYQQFRISEKFIAIPLSYDPYEGVSTYHWNDSEISVKGGFIKGTIIDDQKIENLIVRSLSPIPTVTVKSGYKQDHLFVVRIENINPVNVKVSISKNDKQDVTDPHTIRLELALKAGEERIVECIPVSHSESSEFIILGDNRNGYRTFSMILDQINAINPLFVIDNGDLVFGGEPNKYRLFYETISKLRVPIYTTLGNHDVRENGRPTYTMLFGPPYYSFDYGQNHFVFLDSSRGWAEKQSIPDEEYIWLENDLKRAEGKRIYVISHIPPVDPRDDLEVNVFPNEPGIAKTGYFETLMNNYNTYKSKDHGFPDPDEAQKFENLMTEYRVDTVFLSHIHSYYSYVHGDVRYIISGGAGAELLTRDSYYHYLRVKVTETENYIEMIQLPSPVNAISDRYIAAINLFANSIFKEYKSIIIVIFITFGVFILCIIFNTRVKWSAFLKFFGAWFINVIRFAMESFKDKK